MRVGLIGPLPPELGGATPGGVATHQAHLAACLASLPGVDVRLLATNVTAPRCAGASYEVVPLFVPRRARDWLVPGYLRRVGAARIVRYAATLAGSRVDGSRREQLANLLWYRHFLADTRPGVVHVQHPLERAAYVRHVMHLEGKRWPLVITAHSFFGEHEERVIHDFMGPNLRAADRVIAVSPHIADQAASLGVDRQRVRVIRSGVDAPHYQGGDRPSARRTLGLAPEEHVVLFVGNLEPRKQVPVLLRALARLEPRPLLALVGDGEEREMLRALALELGVGDRIRWAGRVEEAELLDWYAAADVFVLPSSSEAQGIVALEAMAAGLPVVASAVGGLLGTIDDGQSGFLVPAGEVEPLAERLAMLLADSELRRRLGGAARRKVETDFTWGKAAEATLEVYQDVLGCRGA